jgi:hypothetical protein
MPVDLPPSKKPLQAVAALPNSLLEQSLNWLAVAVGFGLCFWVTDLTGILDRAD